MANITPAMVKSLREKTGAGMADCKKALEESNGEMDAAIDYLRKKGAASAAKRADRETNEGIVSSKINENGTVGALCEITCETDFVARNEEMIEFSNLLADTVFNNNPKTKEELLSINYNGKSIQDSFNEILAKFNEKIEIGNFARVETSGYLLDYIHGGNKLGVIIEMSNNNLNDEAKQLVKDITMQIAAMNPRFVDRSQVTQDILDKEQEIYKQQAIEEGKPADIAEKVALGRVNKFYKENCLVEQQFVKDGNKTVADVVKEISSKIGEDVKINQFLRFSIGG